MLFHDREQNVFKRIIQKLKEWIISVRLERQYTKNEIITMYLNKFDFINNAVGIKSASQVYFNKPPDSLKTEEAAMLVGMCKNPALYNPLRRPELTQQRRNIVLHQMYRNGAISEQEYDSLKQTSLNLDYKVVDHKEGPAPYFREVLRLELIELLNKKDPETGKYLISKPGNIPYNIYSDGLKIYTTIDSRMQAYAEWAVTEHMRGELQKDFDRDLKKKRNAPFDWRVSKKEINQILETAMKRTQRYRILAGQECANCGRRGKGIHPIKGEDGKDYYLCTADDCGHQESATPKDSIPAIFDKPVPMKVFSWQGEIDTIMSPMDSIKYYKGFLQTGMMSMDPHTGYVKAWVGGINYKHFSYDHVKQSRRQVGSTFKPMVYALAVQEGIEPCMELPNTPTCFDLPEGGTWCPKNSDAEYGGMISVKYGLANSINTVTAWIMKQFGPKSVVDMARKMGITSPLDPVPSLCLGVADLSVFELTGANATFANKGVWIEPTYITRIEDKNGTIIKEFRPKTSEAMSEETAYVMLEIMKGVVDGVYNRHTKKRIGTGLRLRASSRNYGGIRTPVAGKTGTTQNNSDGWFIGVTPDLVTGVWVGAEDRSVRFSQTNYGQGANTGLPIFGYFMQKAYSDKRLNISQGDFEKPETKLKVELDCEKYYKQKGTGATFFDPETEDFSK
jgi:penicillin-binding protein 1A